MLKHAHVPSDSEQIPLFAHNSASFDPFTDCADTPLESVNAVWPSAETLTTPPERVIVESMTTTNGFKEPNCSVNVIDITLVAAWHN